MDQRSEKILKSKKRTREKCSVGAADQFFIGSLKDEVDCLACWALYYHLAGTLLLMFSLNWAIMAFCQRDHGSTDSVELTGFFLFLLLGVWRPVDGYIIYLTDMGNICGCVRGPKEECYVDPKKAPLSPEAKELKGRRYFQRKKRKSEELRPFGSLRSPGSEVIPSKAICDPAELQNESEEKLEPNQTVDNEFTQVVKHLSRQGSLCKGVYAGEVPAVFHKDAGTKPLSSRPAYRWEILSTDREHDDYSGTIIERKHHGINTTSRRISSRDSLLVKKLLQRQLRRAVSFGAVEHMLQTKIVCDSQAHRMRRQRSYTCSGYIKQIPACAKCVSSQHKVKIYAKRSKHGGDSW